MKKQEYQPRLSDVASEVRAFYDVYPYPPPLDNLDKYKRIWQDRERRRADYHLFWPARSYREDNSILVAGCGTSQAVKHALRWPGAQVTGIDFSATSVRCTEELKQKYNLENLRVRQLPIERVDELKASFDQIVCTGVLHHLGDPDMGLKALRSVLKPNGAMQLMVYAPYGRTGIYMLQEFCKRINISASDRAIRDLVVALKALPPGHPLEILMREAPDFRDPAALADALLHPQDRAYSVPQLFDFIETGGLTFGRWIRQAPYSTHCGIMTRIPQAGQIAKLSLVEQYAAVELFRGTMVRHSMVAYRNDNPDCVRQVTLAGDGWLDYVPIRMADTICIQERLPPGAAAVLINRSHTFKDLFLPLDSTEYSWFDAIDGNKKIGDIMKDGRTPRPIKDLLLDKARKFFERLSLYDQIVFDTSRETDLRRSRQ